MSGQAPEHWWQEFPEQLSREGFIKQDDVPLQDDPPLADRWYWANLRHFTTSLVFEFERQLWQFGIERYISASGVHFYLAGGPIALGFELEGQPKHREGSLNKLFSCKAS